MAVCSLWFRPSCYLHFIILQKEKRKARNARKYDSVLDDMDEVIEGKRSYDVEDKLWDDCYNKAQHLRYMEGSGKYIFLYYLRNM